MPAVDTLFPPFAFSQFLAGNSSERGTYVSPGSRVILLCNSTSRTGDDPAITARCYGGTQGTLASALSLCRANMGDTIFVLPGHSENVSSTALANLVAGTRIVGVTTGGPSQDSAPTFTWNAAGSTWAISVKNVEISGLRLLMDGANGVTAPINITAAGCRLVGNYMRWSSGASNLATTAITVGSGALYTVIAYNQIEGAAAGVCTDGIKLLGATTPDNTVIVDNIMHAACTAANGLINITVAAINLYIARNRIENMTASSSVGILTGAVACDGTCESNRITIKNTGTITSGTVGIKIGAGTLIGFFDNLCVNDPSASGVLKPTVDT
jgi:hypothetical protein